MRLPPSLEPSPRSLVPLDSITCPAGTYGPNVGGVSLALACLPCTAGSYSKSVGAFSCTPCADGYYTSVTGTLECTICPVNTWQNMGLSTRLRRLADCVACPVSSSGATYTSAAGTFGASSSVCTAPAQPSCTAGQVYISGATCSPCAAGYSCAGGFLPAVACTTGQFASGGAPACAPMTCAAGSGVVGKATGQPGAVSATDGCTQCARGQWSAGGGSLCTTITCELWPSG